MNEILNKSIVLVLNRNWQAVNSKKGNRLPREAGLTLLRQPAAVRETPVTALIRNTNRIPDWQPFVKE